MRLMSRSNNVKRYDTSCKTAINMPSLFLSWGKTDSVKNGVISLKNTNNYNNRRISN